MDKEQTLNEKTLLNIRMYLDDHKLLAELYAISAMVEGLKGGHQPQYNLENYRRKVRTEIQNRIKSITDKVEYRIAKQNPNIGYQVGKD